MARCFQGSAGVDGARRATPAMKAYCKAAYCLQQEAGHVKTRQLSQALGLSDATVTKMSKRLHKVKLVHHTRYHGVVLTEEGIYFARKALHHHFLIALYLVETLGYSWDEVEQEAESLEYYVSDQLPDRIGAILGYPTHLDEARDGAPPRVAPAVTSADRWSRR